jgi:hypothetical protein
MAHHAAVQIEKAAGIPIARARGVAVLAKSAVFLNSRLRTIAAGRTDGVGATNLIGS